VVDDGEKLCWADPALGILTVNPTVKPPLLDFISLPQPATLHPRHGGRGFVALSGEAWRYVELCPGAGQDHCNLFAWKLCGDKTWFVEISGVKATNRTEYLGCFCAGGVVNLSTAAVVIHPYTPALIYTRFRGAPWRTILLNLNQFNTDKYAKYKYLKMEGPNRGIRSCFRGIHTVCQSA
jgi:hypothetical protein